MSLLSRKVIYNRGMDLTETKLDSVELYRGKSFAFSVDTVTLPDGKTAKREILHHPGGVAIVAVKDGNLLIEHQYRYAVGEELIEIPAGKLDKIPGEDHEAAAERELLEETGYTAGKLEYLGRIHVSPGIMTEALYIYFATDLVRHESRDLDEDEFLEVGWMPLSEVRERIGKGEMTDAKLLGALMMAEARGLI